MFMEVAAEVVGRTVYSQCDRGGECEPDLDGTCYGCHALVKMYRDLSVQLESGYKITFRIPYGSTREESEDFLGLIGNTTELFAYVLKKDGDFLNG